MDESRLWAFLGDWWYPLHRYSTATLRGFMRNGRERQTRCDAYGEIQRRRRTR